VDVDGGILKVADCHGGGHPWWSGAASPRGALVRSSPGDRPTPKPYGDRRKSSRTGSSGSTTRTSSVRPTCVLALQPLSQLPKQA